MYTVLIVLFGASWRSILIDKRQAEVKLACEQVMPARDRRAASVVLNAEMSKLIQVNEEQRTCLPREHEE